MENNQKQLPDKLSELLNLAIEDAKNLDREKYIPLCSEWHLYLSPVYRGVFPPDTCLVCLAGVVLAGTMRRERTKTVILGKESCEISEKLNALDDMREERFTDAIKAFGVHPTDQVLYELKCLRDDLNKTDGEWYPEFKGWAEFEFTLERMEKYARVLDKCGY